MQLTLINELGSCTSHSLFAVGDISCDVQGSIEFLQHTTTIDKPFFSWNPVTNKAEDEITDDGVAVMGVDILPTELSVESSKHFGEALLPLLKQLIVDGSTDNVIDIEELPPELSNACIARCGSLTPNYQYIEALMKRPAMIHHDRQGPHILLRIKVKLNAKFIVIFTRNSNADVLICLS